MSSHEGAAELQAPTPTAEEEERAARRRRGSWLKHAGEVVDDDETAEQNETKVAPKPPATRRPVTASKWRRALSKSKRRVRSAAGPSAAGPSAADDADDDTELAASGSDAANASTIAELAEDAAWTDWAMRDRRDRQALAGAASAQATAEDGGGSGDGDGEGGGTHSGVRSGRSLWKALVDEKRNLLHAAAFLSGAGRRRELGPMRREESLEKAAEKGVPLTLAEKWNAAREKVGNASNYVSTARRRVRAAQGAAQEFQASGDDDAAYWEQGDKQLHTREIWDLRMDLHGHPDVVEELHRWWVALRTTFAPSGEDRAKSEASFQGLKQTDYIQWQTRCVCGPSCLARGMRHAATCRLYKALVAPYDARDAKKCARIDWHVDRHGQTTMGRLAVYDAMFQLCDLWTRGISLDEYATSSRPAPPRPAAPARPPARQPAI